MPGSVGSLTAIGDPSSACDPELCRVTHLELDWTVKFGELALHGVATWTVALNGPKHVPKVVTFDARDLDVTACSVSYGASASSVPAGFEVLPGTKELGGQLKVFLGATSAKEAKVAVTYATSPQSSAIQWLPPAQTAGKQRPYLFTQCQAIHARALLPCQDAPGVKFTYNAKVAVPAWATALMSALPGGGGAAPESAAAPGGGRVFSWTQPVPISSYLLCLVVGDLEARSLGPRCQVWAEPSVVGKAEYEFAETENFLKAAEKLTGLDYMWGRYDLVCMPPSFPCVGAGLLPFCAATAAAAAAAPGVLVLLLLRPTSWCCCCYACSCLLLLPLRPTNMLLRPSSTPLNSPRLALPGTAAWRTRA